MPLEVYSVHEEELDQVECDTVIVAVSLKPKNELVLTAVDLEGDDRGLPIVDKYGICTMLDVFSAGDVVTGLNCVVHVVAAPG